MTTFQPLPVAMANRCHHHHYRRHNQPKRLLVWFHAGYITLVTRLLLFGAVVLLFLATDTCLATSTDSLHHHHRRLPQLRGGNEVSADFGSSSSSNYIPRVGNVTVPLHYHSGTHHVHAYIGSPPQRQTLIVDTGSRLMAFGCRSCRNCGSHASPYFDPGLSTTDRTPTCGNCQLEGISTCSMYNDQCIIYQKYTEGSSWNAFELQDMVWLGSENVQESVEDYMQLAVAYSFGCQTSLKGLFRKQYADGILGLARHSTSLISVLHSQGVIARNAFSLCFTPTGGHLSLGGTMFNQQDYVEPMRLTPVTKENGWYSLYVERLIVGDNIVIATDHDTGDARYHPRRQALTALNRGRGVILDSGTTDTYLPSVLADAVRAAVKQATDGLTDFSDKHRRRNYSYSEFELLPEIHFHFTNNVTITMRPIHYMEGVPTVNEDQEGATIQPWRGTKTLTNRIYLDEDEGAVLGLNAMYGYDIFFDAQGNQVGIAKAKCADATSSASVLW